LRNDLDQKELYEIIEKNKIELILVYYQDLKDYCINLFKEEGVEVSTVHSYAGG
jgi:hypothetical protein